MDLGIFLRQPDGRRARLGIDAHAQDMLHSRRHRPADDRRPIGVEFFLIEMGVSVEERHYKSMKYEG
jgi:hypothetical protein